MEGTREKFTISVNDKGVFIRAGSGNGMEFSAGEALMLLDILRDEEARLQKMADAVSPLPIKFTFKANK
jgi:N-acetyl-beta-hexosaminidase